MSNTLLDIALDVLEKYPIESLTRLARELGCKHGYIQRLKKSEEDYSENLRDILTTWRSKCTDEEYTLSNLQNALKKIECVNQAEKLGNTSQPMERQMFRIAEDTNFIGRKNDLKILHDWFINKEKCIAITGPKGIGKTKLVKQHLLSLRNEVMNNQNSSLKIGCTIINSESVLSFRNSAIQLLENFNINTTEIDKMNTLNIFKRIFNYFVASKKANDKLIWILTIDNLENEEVEDEFKKIHNYMIDEQTDIDYRSIITTNNLQNCKIATKFLHLGVFSIDECLAFLEKRLESQSMEDKKELSDLLDGFPLAFEQAVVYIIQQKHIFSQTGTMYNLSHYIKDFKDNPTKCLKQTLDGYESTLYGIVTNTVDKIKTSLKCNWFTSQFQKRKIPVLFLSLEILAYVSTEELKCCTFNKLISFHPIKSNDKILKNILDKLKAYSLIKIENNIISIPRLVQQVLQIYTHSDKFHSEKFLFDIIEHCKIESLDACDIGHFIFMIEHLVRANNSNVTKLKTILNHLLERMVYIHLFFEAENLFNKLKPILINELGEFEEDFCYMEFFIYKAQREIGGDISKFKESFIRKYETLPEGPQKSKFEDIYLHAIAQIYHYMENYEKALLYYQKTLEARNKNKNCSEREKFQTRSNIANCLAYLKRYQESENEYKNIISWQEKNCHDNKDIKTDLQRTRHSLGHLWFTQNKFTEACEIFELVTSTTENLLGKYHFRALPMMYMLAKTQHALGNRKQALEILNGLIVEQVKYHKGNRHENVKKSQNLINLISQELETEKVLEKKDVFYDDGLIHEKLNNSNSVLEIAQHTTSGNMSRKNSSGHSIDSRECIISRDKQVIHKIYEIEEKRLKIKEMEEQINLLFFEVKQLISSRNQYE